MKKQKFIESVVAKRFGRGDVINYLTSPPRKKEGSRWLGYKIDWGEVAKYLFNQEEKNCLEKVAIPFLREVHNANVKGNELAFLRFLRAKGVKVFCIGNTFLLQYPLESEEEWGYFYNGDWFENGKLKPSHFVSYIARQHDNKSLRELKGWEFICDRLRLTVELTRDKATADFDSACAASRTGHHIVKADRVWIVKPDLSYVEHDAALFVPRKLPIAKNHHKITCSAKFFSEISLLSMCGYQAFREKPITVFVTPQEDEEGKFPTIFAIAEALVPSNLSR